MKKLLLIIGLISFGIISNAQDTIRIKHLNYTTLFSTSLKYPLIVEWWETKEKTNCLTPLKRKDQFQSDPELSNESDLMKDYVNSGMDRGHVTPCASNLCGGDKVQTECFYFTNMIPQPHTLNAGSWKTLETLTRNISIKDDSVHIWAGAIGNVKTFGVHNVAIPAKCWKVIYIVKTKEYRAYIFPNTSEKVSSLDEVKVKKEDVEKLTGFKFN
jgi:endonuclease G